MHGWMKRLAASAVFATLTIGAATLRADEPAQQPKRGIKIGGRNDAAEPSAKVEAPKPIAPKVADPKAAAPKPSETVIIEYETSRPSGGFFGWLRGGRSGSSGMDNSRTLPNGLPRGRAYYNGRYYGNFNNRYYGPQYGYF